MGKGKNAKGKRSARRSAKASHNTKTSNQCKPPGMPMATPTTSVAPATITPPPSLSASASTVIEESSFPVDTAELSDDSMQDSDASAVAIDEEQQDSPLSPVGSASGNNGPFQHNYGGENEDDDEMDMEIQTAAGSESCSDTPAFAGVEAAPVGSSSATRISAGVPAIPTGSSPFAMAFSKAQGTIVGSKPATTPIFSGITLPLRPPKRTPVNATTEKTGTFDFGAPVTFQFSTGNSSATAAIQAGAQEPLSGAKSTPPTTTGAEAASAIPKATTSTFLGAPVPSGGFSFTVPTVSGATASSSAPSASSKSTTPIFSGIQLPLRPPKQTPTYPSSFDFGALAAGIPPPAPATTPEGGERFNKSWPLVAPPLPPGAPRPGSQGPADPGQYSAQESDDAGFSESDDAELSESDYAELSESQYCAEESDDAELSESDDAELSHSEEAFLASSGDAASLSDSESEAESEEHSDVEFKDPEPPRAESPVQSTADTLQGQRRFNPNWPLVAPPLPSGAPRPGCEGPVDPSRHNEDAENTGLSEFEDALLASFGDAASSSDSESEAESEELPDLEYKDPEPPRAELPIQSTVDTLQGEKRFNPNWPVVAKPLPLGAPRPGSQGPSDPSLFAENVVNIAGREPTQMPTTASIEAVVDAVITAPTPVGPNPSIQTPTTASTPSAPHADIKKTPTKKLLPPAVPAIFKRVPHQKAHTVKMQMQDHSGLPLTQPGDTLEKKQDQGKGKGKGKDFTPVTQAYPAGEASVPSAAASTSQRFEPPSCGSSSSAGQPTMAHPAPVAPVAPIAAMAPSAPVARPALMPSMTSTKTTQGQAWNHNLPAVLGEVVSSKPQGLSPILGGTLSSEVMPSGAQPRPSGPTVAAPPPFGLAPGEVTPENQGQQNKQSVSPTAVASEPADITMGEVTSPLTPAPLNPFAMVNPATLAYNPANPFLEHFPQPKPSASQDVTMGEISTPVTQSANFVASSSLADTTMTDAPTPMAQCVFSMNPPPTTSPFAKSAVGGLATQKPIPKNVFEGMPGHTTSSAPIQRDNPPTVSALLKPTKAAKVTDLPFGHIQGKAAVMTAPAAQAITQKPALVATSKPAASPVIPATPAPAAFIQTPLVKPSEFDLAKAVASFDIPAAPTPALAPPTLGNASSSVAAVPPPPSSGLTDAEVQLLKRIAEYLGIPDFEPPSNPSGNAIPQPSPAPNLEKNQLGKDHASTGDDGENDKREQNDREIKTDDELPEPQPKVTYPSQSPPQGLKSSATRRTAEARPEKGTIMMSSEISGQSTESAKPASESLPKAGSTHQEADKAAAPSAPEHSKPITPKLLGDQKIVETVSVPTDKPKGKEKAQQPPSFQEYLDNQRAKHAENAPVAAPQGKSENAQSTIPSKEKVAVDGTPLMQKAEVKDKAKGKLTFQADMDKKRTRNAAQAVLQPSSSTQGVPAPSLTPLSSVPVAPASPPEAWELELEGLIKDRLISKHLIDNISRGDEWLHDEEHHNALQDQARKTPLTPREIELREYQQINAIYKSGVAKADTRWLKNKKKTVYDDFLATYSFEYRHWKNVQKVKQSQKLLPAAVGKPQRGLSIVKQTASPATKQQALVPAPRRRTQKKASNQSKPASDSSSSNSSPPPTVSAPTEPFWKPSSAEQRVIEVPQQPEISPRKVVSEDFSIVYNGLRDRGYSVDAVNSAIQYARKGRTDCDILTVEACEAWIQAGMVVPKESEDWMFDEKRVAKAPPARDYGLRGGPLLYEDFEEIWAEEAAQKAAKAKAEEAKRAAEHRSRLQVMEGPRRPVSFEYKRLSDIAPAPIHRPTNLLKHSVDRLDVQYSDLTGVERSQGKRAALPRLETLRILAPMEGRTMESPKIVDEYIQVPRERDDRIRMSKTPGKVYPQPAGIQIMAGDASQGFCHDASTKEVVISAVTGAISAATFAVVYAGVTGLYHQYFA